MELVYNAVERLVVFENTGVAFGPVTIYWLVLEIRKVKPLKPSWLIALCAYPRFQKWLEHCYAPHPHPLNILCYVARMRPLCFSEK